MGCDSQYIQCSVDVPNHPLAAGIASIEMIAKLRELREYWVKNNLYQKAREMDVRIGPNFGLAKVGFMGTDALASYTMMGILLIWRHVLEAKKTTESIFSFQKV